MNTPTRVRDTAGKIGRTAYARHMRQKCRQWFGGGDGSFTLSQKFLKYPADERRGQSAGACRGDAARSDGEGAFGHQVLRQDGKAV